MFRTFTFFLIIATVCFAQNAQSSCLKNVVLATGVAKHTYTPTIAMISLGVEKIGHSPDYVQKAYAYSATSLVNYLKSQKVAKLKTAQLSLSANYDYRSTPRSINGYTARTTISFEVPISHASNVLMLAIKYGATKVVGVSYRAEDKVTSEARKYAIMKATKKAAEEAYVATASLSRKMGNPVTIKVTDTFFSRPIVAQEVMRSYSMAADKAMSPPSAPIVAGEQTVRAFVTVTFAVY